MTGASSRVRHHAYAGALAQHNIILEPNHLVDEVSLVRFYNGRMRSWGRIALAYAIRARMAQGIHKFDLIWIEKEILPRFPFWCESRFYGVRGIPTILDFDDFWVERFNNERRGRRKSGRRKRSETEKLRSAICAADVVTAANAGLADALEAIGGRRPEVFENFIDVGLYRRASERASASNAVSRRPRIGWIGTPFTAARFLPPVVEALDRLSSEGVSETVLIGAGKAVPELRSKRIDWTLDGEAEAVAGLDIGIMPLGLGPFDRYKSCWKLYQYMAAGRPVVATRIGFSEVLVEDGVTGFLVDSPEQFEKRLRLLAGNVQLRTRMGQAAQASVAARFDLATGADRLAKMFRSAVAAKRAGSAAAPTR